MSEPLIDELNVPIYIVIIQSLAYLLVYTFNTRSAMTEHSPFVVASYSFI